MGTSLGDTLGELRRQTGQSQRRAAAELGISQALLSHYENGAREPKLDFIVKACDYYKVSADYILGRADRREARLLPSPSVCDGTPRLISAARNAFDELDIFSNDELYEAAVNYLILPAENIATFLRDPNAPHDPMRDVHLKLAEAALIKSARKVKGN